MFDLTMYVTIVNTHAIQIHSSMMIHRIDSFEIQMNGFFRTFYCPFQLVMNFVSIGFANSILFVRSSSRRCLSYVRFIIGFSAVPLSNAKRTIWPNSTRKFPLDNIKSVTNYVVRWSTRYCHIKLVTAKNRIWAG